MWDKAKRIAIDNLRSKDLDLSDIDELRIVERGEDRPLLDLDTSEKLLALNIDQLADEEREGLINEIVTSFESQHRLFGGNPNRVRRGTKSALSAESVQETLSFFEDYLGGPHMTLLEQSLLINQSQNVIRLPRDELDEYKEDIASDFAEHAVGGDYQSGYTCIHMASCGYFSQEGYIRSIFHQLEDEHVDYQRIIMNILNQSPFLVTIGRVSKSDVIDEFKEKLRSADRYQFDVDFVDGRAMGGGNRETLEEAILTIQRDAETLKYDCEVRIGETIYRLYPGSWRGSRN
ncbi:MULTISPECIES: hypothetical protein [unclassified Haloferax]|uniref:hypothetical protein n=1 Tax=unclassified Haloferax TaxID=2625095 RepID=UPI00126711DC|nr:MULTISPECIES: hypothetical protein [unclassified Haloferax]